MEQLRTRGGGGNAGSPGVDGTENGGGGGGGGAPNLQLQFGGAGGRCSFT